MLYEIQWWLHVEVTFENIKISWLVYFGFEDVIIVWFGKSWYRFIIGITQATKLSQQVSGKAELSEIFVSTNDAIVMWLFKAPIPLKI